MCVCNETPNIYVFKIKNMYSSVFFFKIFENRYTSIDDKKTGIHTKYTYTVQDEGYEQS